MFGNLIRECGVLNKLSLSAQNELSSLVTILLGITIASTMTAERFIRIDTLIIIALGLFAFVFDTFGGVIFAKFLNMFRKDGNKINPMIGACGISAFPMSARVIHQMGQKEDPYNYLLMPAISANVGGQIGSVVAGGNFNFSSFIGLKRFNMTPTLQTTLLVALIGIVGIFLFMSIFYLLIKGLDKWLPFEDERSKQDLVVDETEE